MAALFLFVLLVIMFVGFVVAMPSEPIGDGADPRHVKLKMIQL